MTWSHSIIATSSRQNCSESFWLWLEPNKCWEAVCEHPTILKLHIQAFISLIFYSISFLTVTMDWEEQLSHLKHFHKSEIRAHAIVCKRGGIEDWAICCVHMYVDKLDSHLCQAQINFKWLLTFELWGVKSTLKCHVLPLNFSWNHPWPFLTHISSSRVHLKIFKSMKYSLRSPL